MNLLQTFAVAFSLFSALPMPQFGWNEKNMRYAMAAFPFIGVIIALAAALWQRLCALLALPALLGGAGLCLLPAALTGGIHLDGYADTWDALASHAPPERKQEILKDPHMGAFAAIHLCSYFIFSLALWCAAPAMGLGALTGLFTLSRALSGLAVATFPIAPHTGLAHTFADAAHRGRVAGLLLVLTAAAAVLLCLQGPAGAAMLAAAGLIFAYYRFFLQKKFGGLSGDLAGWFLQVAELAMLAAYAFTSYLGALL